MRASDNSDVDHAGPRRSPGYRDEDNDRDEREAYRDGAGPEPMSTSEVAYAGMRHIADLTGKEPLGVVSLEPVEDGWVVSVEVVEDRRIPSSADVLGLYEAEVADDGSLLAYRRSGRYPRGRGDQGR